MVVRCLAAAAARAAKSSFALNCLVMNGLPVPPKGKPPTGGNAANPDRVPRPDQRLGKNLRITKSSSFDEAYAQQNKWVGRFMVLWLRTGPDAGLRLGVVSSRKVGGAVQRNKARRMMREVFRRNRYRLHGAFDLVLVARMAILKADYRAIESDFLVLVSKAGLCSAA